MIFVLSGDIRTGKTTALLHWSKNRNDVDGILCPDDDYGKRYFLKIKSKERFPLEVDNDEDIVSVGNFKFLKSSFEKANAYLITSNNKREFKYFVIDELGRLELNNEGLSNSAEKIILNFQSDENHHLILVVRSSLIETILKHYKIQNYQLITKNDLRENRFT